LQATTTKKRILNSSQYTAISQWLSMKTGRFWTHNGVVMTSIDPFTVGKHGDVFFVGGA